MEAQEGSEVQHFSRDVQTTGPQVMDDSICRTDFWSDQDIPDFEIYFGSNHQFDQNEFRKISSGVQFVLLFCLDFAADSDAVDDESLE